MVDRTYFRTSVALAYGSAVAVAYFVIKYLISKNSEFLFDGATMILWLTCPLWIWVVVSSVVHRADLTKGERIIACAPAIFMVAVWFGVPY